MFNPSIPDTRQHLKRQVIAGKFKIQINRDCLQNPVIKYVHTSGHLLEAKVALYGNVKIKLPEVVYF